MLTKSENENGLRNFVSRQKQRRISHFLDYVFICAAFVLLPSLGRLMVTTIQIKTENFVTECQTKMHTM